MWSGFRLFHELILFVLDGRRLWWDFNNHCDSCSRWVDNNSWMCAAASERDCDNWKSKWKTCRIQIVKTSFSRARVPTAHLTFEMWMDRVHRQTYGHHHWCAAVDTLSYIYRNYAFACRINKPENTMRWRQRIPVLLFTISVIFSLLLHVEMKL